MVQLAELLRLAPPNGSDAVEWSSAPQGSGADSRCNAAEGTEITEKSFQQGGGEVGEPCYMNLPSSHHPLSKDLFYRSKKYPRH
jgi:hypothetical protein